MRMRLIPVVVVLGPVIAGIALAQPTGEQPKPQAHDKATLRPRWPNFVARSNSFDSSTKRIAIACAS